MSKSGQITYLMYHHPGGLKYWLFLFGSKMGQDYIRLVDVINEKKNKVRNKINYLLGAEEYGMNEQG